MDASRRLVVIFILMKFGTKGDEWCAARTNDAVKAEREYKELRSE
jgi:hypothetical protein